MKSPGSAVWLRAIPFLLTAALLVVIPSATSAQSSHCANGIAVPDLANNLGLFDDCVVLLAARDTLAGSRTLNWSANVYIGSWSGVFLSGSPRRVYWLSTYGVTGTIPPELGDLTNLERLDLSGFLGYQLTGIIPPELGNLTNLETLDLSDNQLTGTIPTELGDLTNLEALNLTRNRLTGPAPPELGSLTNLSSLALGGNELSGSIPLELGRLTRLQNLYLWGNQLTGPIPPVLGHLTRLQQLQLSENHLTGPIPMELGNLTNLQVLYLWGNQLTGPIPLELSSLANLVKLSLSKNQLTGEIPSMLGTLANLEILALNENQLNATIPPELGRLSSLQELYLWGNQLTGPIPSELGNLGSLKSMFLHENQLSGEIPAELGDLDNLVVLDLSGNQLTGTIPVELGNMDSLVTLDLSGNQLAGVIPAELGNIHRLTKLSLGGNRLTGCVPDGLRDVADNDFNQLGLPFCADASGAPTISTVTPGADFLTVTWSAPGGPAVSAYDLRHIESAAGDKSDANWTVVDDAWTAGSGALSYRISGLTGGTPYDLQVRAVTAAGDGPWSAAAAGTPATPATWGAIRSFSPPSVAPAGEVVVMITASGYGKFGAVTETLPSGFSYVSSSLEDDSVTVDGREVRFSLFGQTAFTYTVTASSTEGTYSFSGVLRNSDREDVPVGGALTIAVAAGDPLIVRYDANGNGMIEKNEAIAAINDYLFGEGDQAISKAEVIRLINLYLFG